MRGRGRRRGRRRAGGADRGAGPGRDRATGHRPRGARPARRPDLDRDAARDRRRRRARRHVGPPRCAAGGRGGDRPLRPADARVPGARVQRVRQRRPPARRARRRLAVDVGHAPARRRHRADRDALGGPDERAAKAIDGRPGRLGRLVAGRRVAAGPSAATRCSRSPRRWAAAGRPSSASCRWSSTRSTTATTSTPAGPTSACRSSAGRGAWSRRSRRVSTSACRAWSRAWNRATTA